MIRVDVARRGEGAPALDHGRIRVDIEVMEGDRVQAGRAQQPQRPLDVARRDQSRVRDQQRPGETQLTGDMAEPLDGAGAEDEPRAKLEVEGVRHGANPFIVQ